MVAKTNVLLWPSSVELPAAEVHLPPRMERLRLKLQVGLIASDLLLLALGGVIANLVWLGVPADPHIAPALAGFLMLYLLLGLNGGTFEAEILTATRLGVMRALQTVVMAASGAIVVAFFLKEGENISRLSFLIDVCAGTALLVPVRLAFHRWALRRYGAQLNSEVLILDGCDFPAREGMYVLDAARIGMRCDMSDPLMLDRIGRLLEPADRVVIACRSERRRDWAMVMKGANIRAEIVSGELTELGPLGTGWFDDSSTVVVATGSLDLRQRVTKRVLDVTLALFAILALAPLLLLVAFAVRLDSPGPIFFVQDRVGRGNRLFGIYKFRSMRAERSDHAGNRSASRDDDRITRVGRLIRAASIDELPQLFNILKGDMSFVGPRPHALGSLAGDMLFWEVDERYWHRHACKPGLTGLAQVRGFRGATHKESDLTKRLQADLEYIAGWTIWRDISILLATLRVVIHKNAY